MYGICKECLGLRVERIDRDGTVAEPFRREGCTYLPACRGGCAGRRRLLDALDSPDPYCPVVRGEERRLSIRMAPCRELPKTESACTTVVMAR